LIFAIIVLFKKVKNYDKRLSLNWNSAAKVRQKKKSPKNRATSEVFRKVFGSISENSGSFSETFPMLYRLDRQETTKAVNPHIGFTAK